MTEGMIDTYPHDSRLGQWRTEPPAKPVARPKPSPNVRAVASLERTLRLLKGQEGAHRKALSDTRDLIATTIADLERAKAELRT